MGAVSKKICRTDANISIYIQHICFKNVILDLNLTKVEVHYFILHIFKYQTYIELHEMVREVYNTNNWWGSYLKVGYSSDRTLRDFLFIVCIRMYN